MALANQSMVPNQSRVPTGGLASNGATPKKQIYTPFVPDPRITRAPSNSQGTLVNPPGALFDRNTGQAIGNQPGITNRPQPMPSGINSSSQQATTKIDMAGNKIITSPAKSNPSVLAQQQALNKQFNAGLVEDGIAGPKTSAAIAQFGSGQSSQNTNDQRDANGLLVNPPDAKFDRNTGQPIGTTPGLIPSPYVQPPAPFGTTTGTQIGNVANAGQQTPQEAETYQGLLGHQQSGQDYRDAQAEAQRVQQNSVNYAKDYSRLTNNTAGTAGFLTQQSGLQGLLNNQYNTVQGSLNSQYAGATSRLGAANTQQGMQLSAAQAANAAAQTTAQRGLSANQSVLSAVQPQFGIGYGTQVGQPGLPNGGIDSSLNGVSTPANIASIQDFTSRINSIDSQSGAIDTNFSRAVNYAASAGITDTSPILAGLQSRVQSGALGDTAIAGFNQVVEQINLQASALGFAPIDPQNVTPAQLKQIQEAVKKKLAIDKANLQSAKDKLLQGGTSGSSGSSSETGSGGLYDW